MQAVKNYKNCVVPMCKSTTKNTPQKLFIFVPKSPKIRKKWLTLARRNPASCTTTSCIYFCEDHFDILYDMENYIEYTTMGVVSQIRMIPGCLPTKFACQPNRASNSTGVCRPVAEKTKRLALINECEEEMRIAALQQSENLNIPIRDEENMAESTETELNSADEDDSALEVIENENDYIADIQCGDQESFATIKKDIAYCVKCKSPVCPVCWNHGSSLEHMCHKLKKGFTCLACPAKMKVTLCGRMAHIHLHEGRVPTVCWECGCAYRTVQSAMKHLFYNCDHVHKIKFYNCPMCSRQFIRQIDFVNHAFTHRIKVYKCSKCIYTNSLPKVCQHFRIYHRTAFIMERLKLQVVFSCGFCSATFSSKRLKTHICTPISNICHETAILCPCGKFFRRQKYFDLHSKDCIHSHEIYPDDGPAHINPKCVMKMLDLNNGREEEVESEGVKSDEIDIVELSYPDIPDDHHYCKLLEHRTATEALSGSRISFKVYSLDNSNVGVSDDISSRLKPKRKPVNKSKKQLPLMTKGIKPFNSTKVPHLANNYIFKRLSLRCQQFKPFAASPTQNIGPRRYSFLPNRKLINSINFKPSRSNEKEHFLKRDTESTAVKQSPNYTLLSPPEPVESAVEKPTDESPPKLRNISILTKEIAVKLIRNPSHRPLGYSKNAVSMHYIKPTSISLDNINADDGQQKESAAGCPVMSDYAKKSSDVATEATSFSEQAVVEPNKVLNDNDHLHCIENRKESLEEQKSLENHSVSEEPTEEQRPRLRVRNLESLMSPPPLSNNLVTTKKNLEMEQKNVEIERKKNVEIERMNKNVELEIVHCSLCRTRMSYGTLYGLLYHFKLFHSNAILPIKSISLDNADSHDLSANDFSSFENDKERTEKLDNVESDYESIEKLDNAERDKEPIDKLDNAERDREPIGTELDRVGNDKEPIEKLDRVENGKEPIEKLDMVENDKEPIERRDRVENDKEPIEKLSRKTHEDVAVTQVNDDSKNCNSKEFPVMDTWEDLPERIDNIMNTNDEVPENLKQNQHEFSGNNSLSYKINQEVLAEDEKDYVFWDKFYDKLNQIERNKRRKISIDEIIDETRHKRIVKRPVRLLETIAANSEAESDDEVLAKKAKKSPLAKVALTDSTSKPIVKAVEIDSPPKLKLVSSSPKTDKPMRPKTKTPAGKKTMNRASSLSENIEKSNIDFSSGQVVDTNLASDAKKFLCGVCKTKFMDLNTFRSHIKTHRIDEKNYQCLECGNCFVVRPTFVKHMIAYHKIKDIDKYMRDNDNSPAPKQIEIEDDGKSEEVTYENQCVVCRQKFDNNLELSKHFRTHGAAFLKQAKKVI